VIAARGGFLRSLISSAQPRFSAIFRHVLGELEAAHAITARRQFNAGE
jgi:hypothetical protein